MVINNNSDNIIINLSIPLRLSQIDITTFSIKILNAPFLHYSLHFQCLFIFVTHSIKPRQTTDTRTEIW